MAAWEWKTSKKINVIANGNLIPLPTKPRQAALASEELLHGGLLDVALFCNKLFQATDQCIYIGKYCCNALLFEKGGADKQACR
ncbi:hypothetical protein RLJV_15885 [Pseudomonas aeruginosa]|nr:hypothetical protein RLJV_15885 [Pseudomonas aeruginosa]